MSTQTNDKGIQIYLSRPWELIKTSFLVITWIILGIHLEIVGPTLNILARQTGVAYSGISSILVTRGAGYISGNIVGALTQNLVNRFPEGLLSIAFLIASLVVLVTPNITNIYILSGVCFFQGISQGLTDIGGTTLMLMMWGDQVATPLNVVHLGYGIGAVFANLLVKPFLGEEKPQILSEDSTNVIPTQTSNIIIPYSIVSFICILITIGHLVFSISEYRIRRRAAQKAEIDYSAVSTNVVRETPEIATKSYSKFSPRSCGNGVFSYGLSMSIILTTYMFFLSGNDQTFGKFFFAFLKSPEFRISTSGATWVMILYWLSYSVGRLICAAITVFVPVHIALCGLWVCGFFLAGAWFIFVWFIGLTSTNLLVLGAFTGLVFSPTFPLTFGFINQRLKPNPVLIGLLLCGGGLGAMAFQKLAGIVLDQDRKHFPTLLITCVLSTVICFIIAFVISSNHQRKSSNKNIVETTDVKYRSNISEEEQQIETYLTNNQQN